MQDIQDWAVGRAISQALCCFFWIIWSKKLQWFTLVNTMPTWRSWICGLPHDSHVPKATWMLSPGSSKSFRRRMRLRSLASFSVAVAGEGMSVVATIYTGWCPVGSNRRQVSTSKHVCGFESCWCPFLSGMIISRNSRVIWGVETTNHQVATEVRHGLAFLSTICITAPKIAAVPIVFFGPFLGSQWLLAWVYTRNSRLIHMILETGWQEGGQRTRHAQKRGYPKPLWQVSILATKRIEQDRLHDWDGCDWK